MRQMETSSRELHSDVKKCNCKNIRGYEKQCRLQEVSELLWLFNNKDYPRIRPECIGLYAALLELWVNGWIEE